MRMRDKSIRKFITHGIISLYFVRSERNIAYLLIKRLMHQQIFESSRGMRLYIAHKLVATMDTHLHVNGDPMDGVQWVITKLLLTKVHQLM